jgi:uncharacterized protein (DUF58 family)
MSKQRERLSARLVDAARFIAVNGWIAAAAGVPVTLAFRAYSGLLLVITVSVFWQVLAVFALSMLPPAQGAVRTRVYRQMTRWGAVYFGVTALFCMLSLSWGLNLLYLTASFLLSGLICSFVLPRLTLARTSASWSPPAHIFAGDPFAMEVNLGNTNRLLSACALKISGNDGVVRRIHRLAPGQSANLLIRQSLPLRGLQPLSPVALRTGFPFGLFETFVINESRRDVLVYPHLGHIQDEVLVRHKGGEARWLQNLRRKDPQGEFHSLREYKHGDNPRHIHWPTSARLRKLFVREFERQEMHSVLLLLDAGVPAGPEDQVRARMERLEKAISFTATLAGMLTRQSVFFAFASLCPELVTLPYDTGQGHFYALLEALALASPPPESGLRNLAQALSYHEASSGGICLVTPGPLSPQEGAEALGALAHCTVTVSVTEPEFDEYFTN